MQPLLVASRATVPFQPHTPLSHHLSASSWTPSPFSTLQQGGASHREVWSPRTSLQAQATFVCARAPKPLAHLLLLSPVLRLASSSLLFHRHLTPDAAPCTSFQHICIAPLSKSVCHPLGEAHPQGLPARLILL